MIFTIMLAFTKKLVIVMKTKPPLVSLKRIIPLVIIVIAAILFFYLKLYRYLTFENLKLHHQLLTKWTDEHYWLTSLCFILIYIAIVAISVPGATLLTIASGFLFGTIIGTIYVVIAATVGATIIFIAAKTALADFLAAKAGPWLQHVEDSLQKNALNYLLVLRLIPIFPFWLINIVPALLNVKLPIYLIATFVGIIPGSLVYASIGSGLDSLLATNQNPDAHILYKPEILLPMLGLAILAILPVMYKKLKKKKHEK